MKLTILPRGIQSLLDYYQVNQNEEKFYPEHLTIDQKKELTGLDLSEFGTERFHYELKRVSRYQAASLPLQCSLRVKVIPFLGLFDPHDEAYKLGLVSKPLVIEEWGLPSFPLVIIVQGKLHLYLYEN